MKVQDNVPKSPGVYRIFYENLSYIGATFNLRNRLQKHFSYLKNNKHSNEYLQRIYNKHEDCVNYEILKILLNTDRDELLDYETFYHIKYDSINNGFNCDLPRRLQKKFTLTEEQINKAASTHLLKVKAFDRYTGDLIENFNSVSEAANYFGGSTSNISQVCKGKLNHSYGCVFCYENNYDKNKLYMYPNNHKKGKTHSENHKEKLRVNHGKAKEVYKYDLRGNLIAKYVSRSECERQNGLKKEALRYKMDRETPLGEYYYSSKLKNIV